MRLLPRQGKGPCRSLAGRAGKLESAIATLILFVLVIIGVGVYVRQRDVNMGRFGIVSGQASQLPNVQKEEDSGLSLAGLATGDFMPAGKAEKYDTDNLYEKIDGKAPMYQEAGFIQLTTQRFAKGGDPESGFEVYLYDMGNTRNAFSVYSRQKRPDGVDLPELPYEYKTTNAVYISHGKYYIEMIGFSESEELIDTMEGMAEKLAAQLPAGGEERIAELEYFPKEGTVAGSWQLQLKDSFGFSGLTDTYSAKYNTGENTVTIFFSRQKDAEDAKAVAKSYRDFLIANDAKAVTPDSELLKSANASVLDFYGSTEIVFAAGVFVGGVHEAEDRQAAQKAAEVLIGRLKAIND
jgi:hypothetical protein